ncbi:MAG: YqaA family protein [Thermodesulfovibrionales bacterium]
MKPLRRLYDWVLHWAETPYGTPALFALAFAESSFFPVPPDVLLIALSLSLPRKAFRYALVCTAASVLGGMLGFYLGMQFWHVAKGVLFRYVDQEGFNMVRDYFSRYEAWAVAVAGFTPIPYKVFTISAGFFRVDFTVFVIASALSRGARFFLVASMIYAFGPAIKSFIDKYFDALTVAFVVLLGAGFVLLKYVF